MVHSSILSTPRIPRKARKAACRVTAIALTGALVFPGAAFGATYVSVGGSEHTSAASGEGWSWDGADNMTLDNYVGGSIAAEGDLAITLIGENIINAATSGADKGTGLAAYKDANTDGARAESADLSITGPGSLEVNAEDMGIVSHGDITIEDAEVSVSVSGAENVDLNLGIATSNGSIEISDSDVEVTVGGSNSFGIRAEAMQSGVTPEIVISNSNVDVKAEDVALCALYYASSKEEALEHKAHIILKDSEITVGGQVQDLSFELGEDGTSRWVEGQAIGAKGAVDGNSEAGAIATEVSIKALGNKADGAIAQTGDDSALAAFAAALVAMAAAVVGFASSKRRKAGEQA